MRIWGVIAALFGFMAVGLGAFGAHALRAKLGLLTDGAERMQWWQTAAQYHLIHAVALLAVAALWGRASNRVLNASGIAFSVGMTVFSGSLYLMTYTGQRWLGAITPIGGLSFLLGWVLLAVAFVRVP